MSLDASKSAGALLGAPIAQLICASLRHFARLDIDAATEASITAIAVFAVSHLIPNSQGSAPKVTP